VPGQLLPGPGGLRSCHPGRPLQRARSLLPDAGRLRAVLPEIDSPDREAGRRYVVRGDDPRLGLEHAHPRCLQLRPVNRGPRGSSDSPPLAPHFAVQAAYAPPASGRGPPGPPPGLTAQSCSVNEPQVWRTHFLSSPASDPWPHSASVRQIWTFWAPMHDVKHDVVPWTPVAGKFPQHTAPPAQSAASLQLTFVAADGQLPFGATHVCVPPASAAFSMQQ